MSNKIRIRCDNMIETRIKENSIKLNISIDELITRYICRELFMDDYYQPHKLSKEEIIEILKKDFEE